MTKVPCSRQNSTSYFRRGHIFTQLVTLCLCLRGRSWLCCKTHISNWLCLTPRKLMPPLWTWLLHSFKMCSPQPIEQDNSLKKPMLVLHILTQWLHHCLCLSLIHQPQVFLFFTWSLHGLTISDCSCKGTCASLNIAHLLFETRKYLTAKLGAFPPSATLFYLDSTKDLLQPRCENEASLLCRKVIFFPHKSLDRGTSIWIGNPLLLAI